jgi:hypothetical protein
LGASPISGRSVGLQLVAPFGDAGLALTAAATEISRIHQQHP